MESEVGALDVPVLLITFNRLAATREVFAQVQAVRPSRLYIASDGAREGRDGEAEKVAAVREYLLGSITWPCEVKTLFRERNLGCGASVGGAITWFFEYEPMGIILEDDCVPSRSFFAFCKDLLHRYKDDTRIWMIAGYNPLDGALPEIESSYIFTHFGFCWGWATWRRAWVNFDPEMKLWPSAKLDLLTESYPFFESRNNEFDETYRKTIDTWDYQWYFTLASNRALSAVPVKSLIKNIGFGGDATHTFVDTNGRSRILNQEISPDITHPRFVFENTRYEKVFFRRVVKPTFSFRRSLGRIVKYFQKQL